MPTGSPRCPDAFGRPSQNPDIVCLKAQRAVDEPLIRNYGFRTIADSVPMMADSSGLAANAAPACRVGVAGDARL
jgi:hypothetical protein